jgi:hypothetical protein
VSLGSDPKTAKINYLVNLGIVPKTTHLYEVQQPTHQTLSEIVPQV